MRYDVSIIYVYYNTPTELDESVKSVLETGKSLKVQIIIVNNDSPKRIPRKLYENKKIEIINNRNTGYGAGLNKGVKSAKSDILIFTNPDVIFFKNAIKNLVAKTKIKKVGAVGPQMIDEKGEILPTISGESDLKSLLIATSFIRTLFPNAKAVRRFWMTKANRNKEQKVKIISGACIALRKEVFDTVGGFDEQFFMYFEENDFCYRIRKIGYDIVYLPAAKIFHAIGASSQDGDAIESRFEESRFKFLKKYNQLWKAVVAESLFRMTTLSGLLLLTALIVSTFLNLYRINTLMLFIGDFGRDFLAARDMLLTGDVPLVGIPSSVVWLHQGPLSIYFIGVSFLIGNFNPVAPAIFYAVMGIGTVYLVYLLARLSFNKLVGAFAALLYATSPLAVMSTRMPYHTSSIPFFTTLLFIFLFLIMKGRRRLVPLAAFNVGLLLLLELSNAAILLVIAVLLIIKRPKIKKREALIALVAFLFGVLPFILYDITHRFIQTVGFPLWIFNRIRLFFGLASPEKVTAGNLPEALERVYQQLTGVIFPESQIIAVGLILIFLLFILSQKIQILEIKKVKPLILILLWLFIPLSAFMVHTAPGVAYFPLLFPAIIICVGLGLFFLYRINKKFIVILFFVSIANGYFLVLNNYYLTTAESNKGLPPFDYKHGMSYTVQEEAVVAIVKDANGKVFTLKGGGFLDTVATGLDNYKYIAWYYGGKVQDDSGITYTIYEDIGAVENRDSLFFDNKVIFVEKNEN